MTDQVSFTCSYMSVLKWWIIASDRPKTVMGGIKGHMKRWKWQSRALKAAAFEMGRYSFGQQQQKSAQRPRYLFIFPGNEEIISQKLPVLFILVVCGSEIFDKGEPVLSACVSNWQQLATAEWETFLWLQAVVGGKLVRESFPLTAEERVTFPSSGNIVTSGLQLIHKDGIIWYKCCL